MTPRELIASVAVAAYAACSFAQTMDASSFDYSSAVAEAVTSGSSDRRNELRACIRNWKSYRDARRAFAEAIKSSDASRADKLVVIEIGNSTFPRFESVLLSDSAMYPYRSGKAIPAIDIRDSSLSKLIATLSENNVSAMRGEAYSQIDDGNCYFVTVRVDSTLKHVAIYGKPSSRTLEGRLVSQILQKLASAERRGKK